MRRKRIYIAYTGGTIGMKPGGDGYAPAPGFLGEQMRSMPEFKDPVMPSFLIHEYTPLLDSSNMAPSNWIEIAQDIRTAYDEYDGFLILHGTDTMAYTASALSFMLAGLTKPVILTGSQVPLCEVRSDARENLITSLLLAAKHPVPEVTLFFGDRLLRGNRSTKVDSTSFVSFDSPNFPPLGRVGVDIELRQELVLPAASEPFAIRPMHNAYVGHMDLFPGISATIVRNFLQPPLQGLVLGTYGIGNAPNRDEELLAAIREATGRGVVIVGCTQCHRGRVDMSGYETGRALHAAGVISGHDLTREAALTKLHFLLGLGLSPDEVRRAMEENLRGELTESSG